MANMDWFFDSMEKERKSFASVETYAPSHVFAFDSWSALLKEDEESLSQRSQSAKSVRRRVRSLLIDICSAQGVEVFVLAALSTPMSRLCKVDAKAVLPRLSTWWDSSSHPQSLARLSKDVVEKFDLAQVVPVSIKVVSPLDPSDLVPLGARKRRYSEVSIVDQDSYHTSSVSGHNITASCMESIHHPAAIIDDCALSKKESVIDMKLGDLIDFFQQRKMRDVDLQMRCSYSGVPLPSIEINELSTPAGFSGKMEFSLRLSEAVLQFMQARS